LKLQCDKLLSSFAFKNNLRRYILDLSRNALHGTGAHSSTFELILSRFCH